MRSSAELDVVRAEIVQRRTFAAEVARARAVVLGQLVPTSALVVVRCESKDHSHRGSSPRMGEAHRFLNDWLVISRIHWRPSDQLNLRAWERERYLGTGLTSEQCRQFAEDDGALNRWLTDLDEWTAGSNRTPKGPRSLVDLPDFEVATVVFPDRLSPIRPWIRCPRGGEGEELTYRQLAEATR